MAWDRRFQTIVAVGHSGNASGHGALSTHLLDGDFHSVGGEMP